MFFALSAAPRRLPGFGRPHSARWSTCLSLCACSVLAMPCVAGAQDASSLFLLGGQRMVEGRCEEATGLMLRATGLFQAERGTPPEQLAAVWHSLGSAYYCRGLYSKAEQAYLQATAVAPGYRKSEVLASLASVYQERGRYPEALAALGHARESLQDGPGSPDRWVLATILNNEGTTQLRLGHRPEAEASLRRANDLLEGAAGPDPVLKVYVLANLARLRAERRDYREAAVLCSHALALAAQTTVPPIRLLGIVKDSAGVMRRIGEKTEAARLGAWARQLAAALPHEPSAALLVDASSFSRK
jgi:tetratricopeptide (TPR) repeat protein